MTTQIQYSEKTTKYIDQLICAIECSIMGGLDASKLTDAKHLIKVANKAIKQVIKTDKVFISLIVSQPDFSPNGDTFTGISKMHEILGESALVFINTFKNI